MSDLTYSPLQEKAILEYLSKRFQHFTENELNIIWIGLSKAQEIPRMGEDFTQPLHSLKIEIEREFERFKK